MPKPYRIVARPFGRPMYPTDVPTGCGFTDQPAEATVFDAADEPESLRKSRCKYFAGVLASVGMKATAEVEYV